MQELFPSAFDGVCGMRGRGDMRINLEDQGVRERQGTQQLSHLPHTEEKAENTQQDEHLRVHQPEDIIPMKMNSQRDQREF